MRTQVRGPDEDKGDPGEIVEGAYTISGDLVCVRDGQGRELGSEVLRPGETIPRLWHAKSCAQKKAPVRLRPDQLQQQRVLMPLRDRARRRAYENEHRAKQRRAAGVPLQSDPDAIDKQQPWFGIEH